MTSALTISPAPAHALGDLNVEIFKCESECGNMAAFAAGVASGSAVTLAATGSSGSLATEPVAAIGYAAIIAASALTAIAAPAIAAVAVVVVPVAVTAYAYRLWEAHQNSEPTPKVSASILLLTTTLFNVLTK
ncbi:MAG: hypothetical protein V7K27_06650 [Nostoc sp.]|uniref:hypothetical protein n=1 Tax=Nostoc sp. TaxID=1180 RepID=UPI002FF96FAC